MPDYFSWGTRELIERIEQLERKIAKYNERKRTCKRCDHRWEQKPTMKRKPRVCPRCKSPYWDKPYSREDLV